MTVTSVVWKDEGDYGPLYVFEGPPPKSNGALGRPYQPKCVCQHARPERRNEWGHEVCGRCGGEVEHWTTRQEALAVAAEHGLELEES